MYDEPPKIILMNEVEEVIGFLMSPFRIYATIRYQHGECEWADLLRAEHTRLGSKSTGLVARYTLQKRNLNEWDLEQ